MPHNTARGFTTALTEPGEEPRAPDLAETPEPPVVEEVAFPSPPPRTGPGSGRQAWADYATSLDVDPEGLSKLDLIGLVG